MRQLETERIDRDAHDSSICPRWSKMIILVCRMYVYKIDLYFRNLYIIFTILNIIKTCPNVHY